MPKLSIDNQEIEVGRGATIVQAAAKLGIEIPTMCHIPRVPACTSCMVCVVKVAGRPGLVPSCATLAEDGMVIHSEDAASIAVRSLLVRRQSPL